MIESVNNLNENIEVCTGKLQGKITGSDGKRHIVLCGGTGCLSNNSAEIRQRFVEVLEEKGLTDKATVNQVGCFGFCSQGPFVKIYPEDTLYRLVTIDDVKEIVESDIGGGVVVDRLLYVEPSTGQKVSKQDDIITRLYAYGSTQKPQEQHYYCVFVGRRDGKNFKLSNEELEGRYAANMRMVGRVPDALSGAMGNQMFIAAFSAKEELDRFCLDAVTEN